MGTESEGREGRGQTLGVRSLCKWLDGVINKKKWDGGGLAVQGQRQLQECLGGTLRSKDSAWESADLPLSLW